MVFDRCYTARTVSKQEQTMFYIFDVNVFAVLFTLSAACCFLYVYDVIQGRISLRTKWRDLTVEQWVFAIGVFTAPIWIVCMMLTVDK
jgi:hypothetical protein